MSSLTKNQLINELINHGVKPPSSGAKKEKLVQMYEEHVSHFQEAAGEFSSDDEAEKRVNGYEGSVSSISMDVADLDNEDLRAQLRAHGVKVGPIVDSTRRLYERKLAKLLAAAPAGSGAAAGGGLDHGTASTISSSNMITRTVTVTNGTGADHEQFSDSDAEVEEVQPAPASRYQSTATSRYTATGGGDQLRKRHIDHAPYGYSYRFNRAPAVDSGPDSVDPLSPSVQAVYLRDWDDQPSPRRGVHDVRGSYNKDDYLFKSSAAPVNYASADQADGRSFWADLDPKQQPAPARRGWLRPLVKLCMLLLLIAAGVFCYQNYGDSESIEALRESARAAAQKAADQLERLRRGAVSDSAATAAAAAGDA